MVSERLGHSTIVLTLDTYSHVLPTMQQQATARLEKMLYNKSKAQTKTGSQQTARFVLIANVIVKGRDERNATEALG